MSLILDTLPTAEEFFQDFWNKKPFVIRGMIPKTVTDGLIDENHLAGLSMEEEVKSRLVRKGQDQTDWTCDYGPMEESIFNELGEKDWSLLVQNIDQFDDKTAELLKYFNFCPRWLLDDIMVSFSPTGGTVGAHTDSYHVFLVQGKGERRWKIARAAIEHEDYIEDIPLEILKTSFDGEEITVKEGDVIYIPPKFAHQGVSLQPSLTYSVGFLGPSLSEMLIDFAHYIEEHDPQLPRYLGPNLTETAAPFQVTPDHVEDLKSFMTTVFDQDLYCKWLTQYFSRPSHNDGYDPETDEGQGNVEGIISRKTLLIKPPSVKIMFAPLQAARTYNISVGDYSFELEFDDLFLVDAMAQESAFAADIFTNHRDILKKLLEHDLLIESQG